MPAKSQSQRGLIFSKRSKYGSKEKSPKKWKWVFEEGWENKGKLPKKVKKNKKLLESIQKFRLFESEDQPFDQEIYDGFDRLGAEIESLEVTIREFQPRPGESGDDLDIKYRVLADNMQKLIREFKKQYMYPIE